MKVSFIRPSMTWALFHTSPLAPNSRKSSASSADSAAGAWRMSWLAADFLLWHND